MSWGEIIIIVYLGYVSFLFKGFCEDVVNVIRQMSPSISRRQIEEALVFLDSVQGRHSSAEEQRRVIKKILQ